MAKRKKGGKARVRVGACASASNKCAFTPLQATPCPSPAPAEHPVPPPPFAPPPPPLAAPWEKPLMTWLVRRAAELDENLATRETLELAAAISLSMRYWSKCTRSRCLVLRVRAFLYSSRADPFGHTQR